MDNIMEQLQMPFKAEDIEWRVQRAMKTKKGPKATVMAYVTNRAIMNRLDEVFGVGGWKNEYVEWRQKGVMCGITVKIGGEWVTKWDASDETNIESTKGGFSGAMKRAAVQFGIGRYLYNLDEYWVDIKDKGQFYIKSGKGNDEITGRWDAPTLPAWALPSNNQPNNNPTPSHYQELSVIDLEAKWETLAGTKDGFEKFFNDKIDEGHSYEKINDFLQRKIDEKQK
ncbi:Rad52/Rad22 family DNA repair protein [Shouchella miscanthi]|uniref:Rad52/Rad22 family DNA repair protein n=1 Tax=Shouchella miscanthi TaxID=2598861 RepID=UPI0011AA6A53|nr:Rad52/Rad22 family DNA repair protein [Shouchella miscanthi]